MYRKILVALENGAADRSLLPHVTELAMRLGSELLLVHVADGWAARHFSDLNLAESEEMKADKLYLDRNVAELQSRGLKVSALLALGEPSTEILKTAVGEHCELIAMASHGHRLFGDLLLGSTIHQVRHGTTIPMLVVRADMKQP